MYSPLITDKRLYQARKAGLVYQRYPREDSIAISKAIEDLRNDGKGGALEDGALVRDLDSRERKFIESERLLCKVDFDYFLTRYHSIEMDPGVGVGEGIGAAKLLESQRRFVTLLGRREEVVHAEHAKFGHTEGIRVYAHKCRQVAFTTTSRALTLHRMLFWPGTRAFAGTLEPAGQGELYKRDKLTLERLPFWLKPELYPDVKDTEIGFRAPLSARLLYQAENQKTGIGVGTQQDVSHLTEVSLWKYPYQIGFSFAPALPKSRMTLHIQEATSNGAGDYWQDVTEACRKRLTGYESWTYVFVPWWMNTLKYRANPPDNWVPEQHTIEHAALVERTSPEWNDGNIYRLSISQMFWYESERGKYARDDRLASFLMNFPATPDQSFANWNQGALPVQLLEEMEHDIRQPYVYGIEVAN